MSIKRTRYAKGIELSPEDLTSEDLSRSGEVAYDSSDDKLKYRNASATKEVANTDEAQTLENKTIDGTSATGNNVVTTDADQVTYDNTTSTLTATDVQAAIDELKVGLDNQNEASEIDYDNSTSGLTATNVQTAIDEVEGRVDTIEAADYVNSFNTRTGDVLPAASDYDADQIDYDNATSSLTATNVQDAVDEVEGRLDTAESNITTNAGNISTNASNLTDHLNDISDAHDASAISYDNTTSTLVATDVQAAVDEVEGRVDDVEDHVVASSDVHGIGVTADVVGTDTQQVLTNKDIDGETASNVNRITFPKETKANLDALTRKEATVVYSTDQSKLFVDNGTDLIPVGSGEGTGSYNYIENGTADLNADGWTVYANTTAGSRPDDFGGTPAGVTFTRSETLPLVGDASFLLSKDAVNRQGSGAYYEFDVENGHQTIKSLLRMLADTSNANIADGDLGIFLVMSDDNFVSDFFIVEPNNPDISAGLPQIFKQLQFNGGKTKGRLCIHIRSVNATAYTAKFDSIVLGPHEVAVGTLVTDFKKYTPTTQGFGTVTNFNVEYRRVGDSLEVRGRGTAGTVTSTEARISLPNSITVKSGTSLVVSGDFASRKGTSTTFVMYILGINDASYVGIGRRDSTSVNYDIPRNGTDICDTGDNFSFNFVVPIQGWSTNTISSEDFGGRDVVVRAAGNNGAAITASVTNINFTEIEDTTGSWNGTSFTAPENGIYAVSGMVFSTTAGLSVLSYYIDDVRIKNISDEDTNNNRAAFGDNIKLLKGQVLTIRSDQSITLSNNTQSHHLTIIKWTSPQTILETETVAARYTSNSGQVLAANAIVVYEDLNRDTHNAYNTSTGIYTVPISGWYNIGALARATGTGDWGLGIEVDGTPIYLNAKISADAALSLDVNNTVYLNKGQEVNIYVSSAITLRSVTIDNTFSIYRIK